jgi:hypothetical protein
MWLSPWLSLWLLLWLSLLADAAGCSCWLMLLADVYDDEID